MPKFQLPKDLSLKDYRAVWSNNGTHFAEDGKAYSVEMEDALAHPNSTEFFPITVENMVREAIEPMLIGTSILERIQYRPGLQMSFPSIGAITADDVDEAGEYPEHTLNFGPGAQIITIGKSGSAIKFTDEWKRYSQFDMISMYIRALGKAMARHKESKFFAMLSSMGVTTHNNLASGAYDYAAKTGSIFGTTTGYDISGSANGGISAEDIMEAYGQVLANGFTPNAIVVHPLTFTMFLIDPVLRHFALQNGGGSWFNGFNGSGQTQYPWEKGLLGKRGPGLELESPASDPMNLQNNATMKMPDYFGVPLKVIVSPFVPYNHSTKLTDIYMLDTTNVGALIVDEEPTMEEIPDRLRDITKIKVRERYALAAFNSGNAVAVMKNVKVTPNRLMLPVQATLGTFTPQNRTTDLTGTQLGL